MELYLAILSVVGLQGVVYHINSIVLDMLLQHRVPVNQEPEGHIQNIIWPLKIISETYMKDTNTLWYSGQVLVFLLDFWSIYMDSGDEEEDNQEEPEVGSILLRCSLVLFSFRATRV